MKASSLPSGENAGEDSAAVCTVSLCAAPPLTGTRQISPCQAKAMVLPSGESAGSCGRPIGSAPALNKNAKNAMAKPRAKWWDRYFIGVSMKVAALTSLPHVAIMERRLLINGQAGLVGLGALALIKARLGIGDEFLIGEEIHGR